MRFNALDLNPTVVNYACEDACWTLMARNRLREQANTERPAMFLLEHQISRILAQIEAYGVGVDWVGMHEALALGEEFLPEFEKATRAGLSKVVGHDIGNVSLDSPKQLQELLYKDMGLRTTRLTPGADKKAADTPDWMKMSTDATALNGLARKDPAVRKLTERREIINMLTRLRKWTSEVEPYASDGRAHPNYRQAGTEDARANAPGTGRFSANDPPIQQCPKADWRWSTRIGADVQDSEQWADIVAAGVNGVDFWTGRFRDFIMAAPGHYLLSFDFSQIELRILAGESQEPTLL
jgi:DNA polymerase-1